MPHKRAKRSRREQEKQAQYDWLTLSYAYADYKARTADSAPTASTSLDAEDVPKSAARILNAASIQQKYRDDKKRAREEDEPAGKPTKRAKVTGTSLKIQVLSIARHFSLNCSLVCSQGRAWRILTGKKATTPRRGCSTSCRRVEDSLRPAVQAARTTARKAPSETKSTRKKDDVSHHDDEQEDQKAITRQPQSAPKEFAKATSISRVRDVVLAPPSFANDRFATKTKAKLGGQGKSKTTDVVSSAHKRMMELEREKAIARYRALKASKASMQSS